VETSEGGLADPLWREGAAAKVALVQRYLASGIVGNGSVALYTDLDVLALRPYAELLGALGDDEMAFMASDEAPCGTAPGELCPIDPAFFLVRPTPAVAAFLSEWLRASHAAAPKSGGRKTRQQMAVRHLLAKPFAREAGRLRWKVLPSALVTGRMQSVGPGTVAFHALGASDDDAKFGQFDEALARLRATGGRRGAAAARRLHCNASSLQARAACAS